ncbi:MAG: hypothetical protein ACI8Z1_000761 [Candidatus Azotimanducaceae bacterium]|jgi:hypothetical protein
MGCKGDPLHPDDQDHFTKLAKNRFHTFLLGMRHASENSQSPERESGLLIRGMVKELQEGQGLKAEWQRYHFADSTFGKSVSEQLEPTEGWIGRLLSRISR